jgi:hypothetical protein
MSDETNTSRPLTVKEALMDLQRDVLTMPDELVLEQLKAHGLPDEDPQAFEHLHKLLRQHKRASWVRAAENDKQRVGTLMAKSVQWLAQRAQALLDAGHLEAQMAFSGRSPEAMSEDELRSIFEDLALVELLEELEDE